MNEKDLFLAVPGHLYPEEGYHLQNLVAGMNRVLEVGTYKGRSAVAMAAVVNLVVTLDHYQGCSQLRPSDQGETLQHLAQLYPLADRIRPIVCNWIDFVDPETLSGFDAVFYDAAHTPANPYEKDFLAVCAYAPYPGLIMVHDYKPRDPGMQYVVEAVDEFERTTGRKCNRPIPGTSIAWFDPLP